MLKTPIAILGSGTGSNARALIEQAEQRNYEVKVVISSKLSAGIVHVADAAEIPSRTVRGVGEQFVDEILSIQSEFSTSVLVLAGFMRLLSKRIVEAYCGNVLNIHPALLPKFGGKGMYGIHVHKAVLEANETVSGATVHIVTENYDEGAIIAQQQIALTDTLTPEQLQQLVKNIEHTLYPSALESYILSQMK